MESLIWPLIATLFMFLSLILALISFLYAKKQGNVFYAFMNSMTSAFYLLWIVLGLYIIFIISAVENNWGIFLITVWSALAAIPHIVIWADGRKNNDINHTLAGTFGVAAVIAATVGVGILRSAA